MADVATLAEAVAASLSTYGATMQYTPETDLAESASRQIVVMPYAVEYKAVSRGLAEETLKVQVAVLKKAAAGELGGLVEFTRTLATGFLRTSLDGATCTGVAFEPLYSHPELREKGLFASVFTLVFKKAVQA